MNTKPYKIHVIMRSNHAMGDPNLKHKHVELDVQRPVYNSAQENLHPYNEWISFAAKTHPKVKELKAYGYSVDHVLGAHPEGNEEARNKALAHIANADRVNANIGKKLHEEEIRFRDQTLKEDVEYKVGDMVHLGFKVKGGAGYDGKITKIDGNEVHIKSKYNLNTYVGHRNNLTKIHEEDNKSALQIVKHALELISEAKKETGVPTGTNATQTSNYLVKHYGLKRTGKYPGQSNPYEKYHYHDHFRISKEHGDKIINDLKNQGWTHKESPLVHFTKTEEYEAGTKHELRHPSGGGDIEIRHYNGAGGYGEGMHVRVHGMKKAKRRTIPYYD